MRVRFATGPVGLQGLLLVILSLCAGAGALSAQDSYATAFVPPGHWSVDAIARLSGLGLVPPGHDISQRMRTQREVGEILEAAAAADSAGRTPAAGWRARFSEEFALGRASDSPIGRMSGSAVEAGWTDRDGAIGTGWGYGFGWPGVDWNQPPDLPDQSEPTLEGSAQFAYGPAAARVTVAHPAGAEALREAYVTARAGVVTGWVGRREFAWGPGVGSGLVMNGGRYDSFGFQTSAFRLPWILRRLGPVSLEMALGTEDFERSFENAGFLSTRGSVTPHERLQLGVTRAAVFGGEGNTEIDLFAVISLLIGKHSGIVSELDNQIVAVDASFRLPTERWVPARAYVEWGFEDSAGAFRDVPGILAGIDVPAVPGVPGLALAVERVSFAGFCCGNPIWYRHYQFRDGWTQDGRPLGHPLAGHGEEWSGRARLHVLDARLRLDGSVVFRDRGIENLYADRRAGESVGGTLAVESAITEWLQLRGVASLEDGEGWREVGIDVGLRAIL